MLSIDMRKMVLMHHVGSGIEEEVGAYPCYETQPKL